MEVINVADNEYIQVIKLLDKLSNFFLKKSESTEYCVYELRKEFLKNDVRESYVDKLKKEDWNILYDIWKSENLPLFHLGMPSKEFEKYQEKFNELSDRYQWRLTCVNFPVGKKKLVEDHFFKLLKKLVAEGDLPVFDENFGIISTISPKSNIRVNDINLFFARWNIEFQRYNLGSLALELLGVRKSVAPKQSSLLKKPEILIGNSTAGNLITTDIPCVSLSRSAITKLALKAAWQIECEFNAGKSSLQKMSPSIERVAVMERLRKWAKDGSEAETLKAGGEEPLTVIWSPKSTRNKSNEKTYNIDSLKKCLAGWHKRREEMETEMPKSVTQEVSSAKNDN